MDLLFFEPDAAREREVAAFFSGKHNLQCFSDPGQFLKEIEKNSYSITLVDIDHFDDQLANKFFGLVRPKSSSIILFGITSDKTGKNSERYAEIDMSLVDFSEAGLNELTVLIKFLAEKQGFLNADSSAATEITYIGESPLIKGILSQIRLIKNSDFHILVTGETGSGKTELARYIHYNSKRKNAPFMHVNCAAIPDNLLETEFFGYRKGAFTGAVKNTAGKFRAAKNGTICLDEIAEIPMHLQAKLLKVLDEKQYYPVGSTTPETVRARIIAATNKDITTAITSKRFREDLYYRLNTFEIHIPALCEHKEDIPELFRFFVKAYTDKNHLVMPEIEDPVFHVLMDYNWGGNIRELQNAVQAVMYLEPSKITVSQLPQFLFKSPYSKIARSATEFKTLKQVKKDYVNQVFELNNKSKMKTARVLNIDIKTLNKLIEQEKI